MTPSDWLHLALWLIGGLVVFVGVLGGLLWKGRDQRMDAMESARTNDNAEFKRSLEKIVLDFTNENRETRTEFKEAVTSMTGELKVMTAALSDMRLTLASNYATFDDLKELKQNLADCQKIHLLHPNPREKASSG